MRWLFDGNNVLENESRASIYRFIKENPGTYSREIMRETNIRKESVHYHLNILLYAGMVACQKDGRVKKYRTTLKAVV